MSKKAGQKADGQDEILDVNSEAFRKRHRGFSRGLNLEKIIDVLKTSSGHLYYRVKWEGCEQFDYVLNLQLNKKEPEKVILFLEKLVFWKAKEEVFKIPAKLKAFNGLGRKEDNIILKKKRKIIKPLKYGDESR